MAVCRETELVDWRITARAPLSLSNKLPMSGHFILWELEKRDGPLIMRERGKIAGDQSAAIHSVDMRRQVCQQRQFVMT